MTDWPVKTLGDICEVFDDGDWIESKDQASSGVRLIQTGNVGEGEFKDRSDKARFISELTFSRLRCTEIIPGDLLVSRLPDPVGRACLIPDTGSKMITAVDCTIMRPRKDIMLPQFLVSSTQTSGYREQVRAKITGTTRDRISRSKLAEVQVSVPPLEEQKRIVALLDAATARVTELTACYEQARTHANNLFTSALRDALESNPDWPVKTLGEICELQRGHDLPTPERREGEVPILGSTGVTGFHNVARYEGPGVAIGRSGFIGGAQYCDVSYWPLNTCLFVKNFFGNEPRWVYYVLKNIDFSQYNSGTTQPSLNRNNLSHIPVSTPSLGAQQEIVAQLELTVAKTSEMVAAYDAKLTAAKNLRQSILEAAFAGDL